MALAIHARPDAVERLIGLRREFLRSELARERETLKAIRADRGPRAGVALAMVRLVIRQFELELAWLGEAKASLTSRSKASYLP
jgi:hypothetical protein